MVKDATVMSSLTPSATPFIIPTAKSIVTQVTTPAITPGTTGQVLSLHTTTVNQASSSAVDSVAPTITESQKSDFRNESHLRTRFYSNDF